MNSHFSCPPILFLIFNRPIQTLCVFESIRKARPSKLYIAADGARPHKLGDSELCMETRNIVSQIDWDCEVHTLFRENNLGCACAVREAINWFFSFEEAGIILEDDCVPSESFYPFCRRMLDEYHASPNVFMISGFAPYCEDIKEDTMYHFSRWANIWGWATWRNRWELYDLSFPNWNEYKVKFLNDKYFEKMKGFREWIVYTFDKNIHHSDSTAWSWAWTYALFSKGGLCLTPNKNLISNIGNIGEHSNNKKPSALLNTHLYNIDVENIVLRDEVRGDKDIDEIRVQQYMNESGIISRVIWRLGIIMRKFGFFKNGNNSLHPMNIAKKIVQIFR